MASSIGVAKLRPRIFGLHDWANSIGPRGLPFQINVLARHGLKATYFVDPMFSFALGLDKLVAVVDLIQAGGQTVELHLHPEWLTDPRCAGLGEFRGPFLSAYPDDEQAALIDIALRRIKQAGVRSISAFRAGSWGCDLSTLRVLQRAGISLDCSLNAAFEHALPSLAHRDRIHDPITIDAVTEVPVTRFDDGVSKCGRPLSLVGVSTSEMRRVLEQCHAARRETVVIVLHSNEFSRTERLWEDREIMPRRLVARRFEWLCGFLATESRRFRTRCLSEVIGRRVATKPRGNLPTSTRMLTAARMGEQLLSRWY